MARSRLRFVSSVPMSKASSRWRGYCQDFRPAGLGTELSILAKQIAEKLGDRKLAKLAVGNFAGPASLRATAGPLITQILSAELVKCGLAVEVFADYSVDGWFERYEDKQSKHLGLRIWGKLTDSAGKALFEFNRAAFGTSDLLPVFGPRVSSLR